ncbi:hypothetical protein [Epibacterium sp. Ofav1-8]|jgi:hypothetical protein|uniref:hypothetical protein n=1 Tax=Epibacterium sp. Ofav1-8 TaxID=2917735 RepID=UPI001EF5838C|nr:hypothetical protein [Epibacterium sp. Ofav1-8]MCG7621788.1 hypothetical protein [Epibacterium sp. Ofav1-8]
MTHLIRTTALVATMATAAGASTMVQDIDVDADASALKNSGAVAVWSELETDLETALAAQLVHQLAEEGQTAEDAAEIDIEIDTVALASSLQAEMGIADSVLEGDVSVDLPGSQYDQRYTLTVSAEQANVYYPEGTDVTTLNVGSEVFYTAMVDAFATHVAEKLK